MSRKKYIVNIASEKNTYKNQRKYEMKKEIKKFSI